MAWCKSVEHLTGSGGLGRFVQAAAGANLTKSSLPNGTTVFTVMKCVLSALIVVLFSEARIVTPQWAQIQVATTRPTGRQIWADQIKCRNQGATIPSA